MFSGTVVGRVTREPKQFGKAIKFTIVHNPGQNSGFESRFVEITIAESNYQAKSALALVRGDTVTAAGRIERKKWKNKEGVEGISEEMAFPELHIPYEVYQRAQAEPAAPSADHTLGGGKGPIDPFADEDIPF